MERRTKIVATLGPASRDPAVLRRMVEAGLDVARLNFSHGDPASHAEALGAVRAAARAAGRTVGILQDLCGPKVRVGDLPGGGVDLEAGQEVVFAVPGAVAPPRALPVEYAGLARDVAPGDRVLFDDGALEARVLAADGGLVRARVVRGGRLRSRKGMNLPGVSLSTPSVTAKDLSDLEWGLAHGVDVVALSFVRRPSDLDPVRERLAREADPPLLIAKIETPEGVENAAAILDRCDGLMVARGDLGVELDFAALPAVQKHLIRLANERDAPVITATQMLESMMGSERPTRAEASDVANAVLDGTDAVMLSGETAAGAFPVEAVTAMARIAREADALRTTLPGGCPLQAPVEARSTSLHDALALGAERLARALGARALVGLTNGLSTARGLAAARPAVPLVGLTPEPRTLGRLALLWGVRPVLCPAIRNPSDGLRHAFRAVRELGLAAPGETVVVVVGRGPSLERTARIHAGEVPPPSDA